MKKIELTQNQIAFIDDEDYERCNQYNWIYNRGNGYAQCKVDGADHPILLHIFILNYPAYRIDHKNRNKLDCQKDNLRIATLQQNSANSNKRKNTSSNYKGVSWYKRFQRWCAGIQVDGRSINLGYFDDEVEAAKAYDVAALQYFGEYAAINFPEPIPHLEE